MIQKMILSNTRRPDISFYPNGRIDIVARVARMLDLHDGDVIDIAVDDKGEYLLYRKYKGQDLIGRHEAQCHATKTGARRSNNIRAWSKRLSLAILQVSDADGETDAARLPVGEPTTLPGYGRALPIIYKRNIRKES